MGDQNSCGSEVYPRLREWLVDPVNGEGVPTGRKSDCTKFLKRLIKWLNQRFKRGRGAGLGSEAKVIFVSLVQSQVAEVPVGWDTAVCIS